MSIHCKTCGAPLEEASMDRMRGLARCRHCDTVVELDFTRPTPAVRGLDERSPAAMPSHFTVERVDGRLQIRWQWYTLKAAIWAAATVVWFGALISIYAGILGPDGPAETGALTQQLLFTIGHVAMGLVFAYMAASGFLNTTTITATHDSLHIQHAPLPWLGNGTVEGIRQLYSKERVQHRKGGRHAYSYELHVIVEGGEQRKLIAGLNEAEQALWLEQALEAQLGIHDRRVGGELPRH